MYLNFVCTEPILKINGVPVSSSLLQECHNSKAMIAIINFDKIQYGSFFQKASIFHFGNIILQSVQSYLHIIKKSMISINFFKLKFFCENLKAKEKVEKNFYNGITK